MPTSARRFINRDDGAAGVIAVVMIALGVVLATTIGSILAASNANTRLQELTDTVARHAADMQRGAGPGFPCQFARQYLIDMGAELTNCRILGNDVAIEATVNFSIWVLNAQSKAGPM